MVDLGCPLRRWFGRFLVIGALYVGPSAQSAEPVLISQRWWLRFAEPAKGSAGESSAIPWANGNLLVVVVDPGSNGNGSLMKGGNAAAGKMVAYDEVSRIGFVKAEAGNTPRPLQWLSEVRGKEGDISQAAGPEGIIPCKSVGWVRQVGGKILPLALLKIEFEGTVPPPGTAILDPSGRVAAILFQAAATGGAGYAIPVEAVHRVHKDLLTEGRLVRGWLGLALRAESKIPKVVRVLPDSPAAAAGIRAEDILVSIGSRPIADYPDAANAFFYLIPGQPVPVKLSRGNQLLEFSVSPSRAEP